MATNSLHLTTFCLQYSPPVVACVCIHLACKWSNWEIPVSNDSKHWWEYVDSKVTLELLDELTHEFLQILEKTPSRLKRIRNWKASGQTTKKPKEVDKTETMMNMISMASSESTLVGLMSLSAASTSESPSPTSSTEEKQPVFKVPNPPEPPAPTRVSLSEYRAKHADELAAQKKKLENMEASVKREYATAAQALMNQQRKEKHHHNHHQQQAGSSSSEPIVLKIPLEERQERGSIKMRLPNSSRGAEQDLKLKLRIPEKRSGPGDEGKNKEKHRDRSNHHHHHHHHNHHHHHSSGSSTSSSAHKHSSSASASAGSKKSDLTRTSSRKRTHSSESSSGAHPSKVSKLARNSYQLPPLPTDILPSLALAHNQGGYSHPKTDKADTNGHGAGSGGQSNEFQDTFDMLNSLLSAQGVQPAQPQMFNYHPQYAEYRYSASSRGGNPHPPPLPAEPPPQLPPLPE